MIKKFMSMILKFICALILQIIPVSYAHAGICTLNNSSAIDITVNEQIQLTPSVSAPSSSTVLFKGQYATGRLTFTCNGSTQWQSAYSRSYIATAESNVYTTEVKGIGVRIKWPESYSNSYYVPSNSTACLTTCTIKADNVTLEFIHIGAVDAGAQIIPQGEIAKAYFLNSNGTLQFMRISLGANVVIVPKSCAIYPSANHIDLGTYDKASFAKSKAGSLVDFNIHISCPVASNIGLTFDSTNNVFSSGSGDIGVDKDSVPGVSIKVFISTISASLYSAVTLQTRSYSFNRVLEKNIPMRAQLFLKDNAAFESQGGAGNIKGDLLYTMTIK